MKNKKLILKAIFTFCVALPLSLIFVACGNKEHTHEFSSGWTKNSGYHWHACSSEDCAETSGKEAHSYTDDNDFTCNVCGYERVANNNIISINEIANKVYNGEPQGVESSDYSVTYGTAKVEYKKSGEEDSAYTQTKPVNAGTYVVKVSVEGNAVYGSNSATREFVIAPKQLANISVSKRYDGNNVVRARLTAENGVIGSDVVNISVSTRSDYTKGVSHYTNAGNKTVVSAQVDNDNYCLPATSEITYVITKANLNLTIDNKIRFDDLYVNTSMPVVSYTKAKVGDLSTTGAVTLTWEKDVDGTWVKTTSNEAIKEVGRYRITVSVAEGENFNGGSVSYEFNIKAIEEVTLSTNVSLETNSTRKFLFKAPADGLYRINVSAERRAIYAYNGNSGAYTTEVECFDGDLYWLYENENVIIDIVNTRTNTNQPVIRNDEFGATIELNAGENSVTTVAGKWIYVTLSPSSIDQNNSTAIKVEFDLANVLAYAGTGRPVYEQITSGDVLELLEQGSEVTLIIYSKTATTGTITITEM